MTILLVIMWIFVIVAQARAVIRREIMMPGKDEDKGKPYSFQHPYLVILTSFNSLQNARRTMIRRKL
jgi:hypothetical protein